MVKLSFSGALLAYLFHKMDFEKTLETLKKADLNYILLAAFFFLIVNVILLIRWSFFLKALNLQVSFLTAARCLFIGLFFNLFFPTSTGGDVMKIWFLFKNTEEKGKAVASVVADRLWGFLSIVLIGTVAYLAGHHLFQDQILLLAILILATVSFSAAFVLFHEKSYTFCCRIFSPFPKLKENLIRFHHTIALLKNKKWDLLIPVAYSCLGQIFFAFTFYFIAKALHQDINIVYFLIFVPLICVVSSLPSIAGLGFRDFGAAYLFAKVGMATGTAVSMTLINFVFMLAIGLVGGVIYVFALSPRRIQHHQADSAALPEET